MAALQQQWHPKTRRGCEPVSPSSPASLWTPCPHHQRTSCVRYGRAIIHVLIHEDNVEVLEAMGAGNMSWLPCFDVTIYDVAIYGLHAHFVNSTLVCAEKWSKYYGLTAWHVGQYIRFNGDRAGDSSRLLYLNRNHLLSGYVLTRFYCSCVHSHLPALIRILTTYVH